ncbi:MAG: hypothetical protein ABSD70_15230 [Terracidiphilus sp.]|jgi:hypothetical protein
MAVATLTLSLPTANAQSVDAPAPTQPPPVKERYLVSKFPDKPSLPASWTIPLDPLGYTAPGSIYLGARNALASLDFLDENHLLFTFRVPGLLHRESEKGDESTEREIRAVVLTLPQGAVAAEAQWTLHDRARYVWALKDGHFLLRDRNSLLESDATLALKPVLDFPGNLIWLDLDPGQRFLVTNSREPVAKPAKSPTDGSSSAESNSNQAGAPAVGSSSAGSGVASPATASADVSMDDDSDQNSAEPDMVVRILRRESGDVLLVSRVRSAVHLPINSEGYLENLRGGRAAEWVLNLSFFTGGSRMLGSVQSTCSPNDDFLSEDEILVTGCGSQGETKLVAMTTAGRTLWATQAPPTEIWPKLITASNGLRFAWETLDTDHSVNSYAPMAAEDIKEQSVTVFDAANGDIALVSPVSPILDAGGNVAISPSGRRVALLHGGAIQVFELPAPPALPTTPAKHSGH